MSELQVGFPPQHDSLASGRGGGRYNFHCFLCAFPRSSLSPPKEGGISQVRFIRPRNRSGAPCSRWAASVGSDSGSGSGSRGGGSAPWNWGEHPAPPRRQDSNLPAPLLPVINRGKCLLRPVSLSVRRVKGWPRPCGTDEYINFCTGNSSKATGAQWVLSASGCCYRHGYKGSGGHWTVRIP